MSPSRPAALVSGGAKRVGRAIALELARAGCDVWITYHRSAEEAREVDAALRAAGSKGGVIELALDDLARVEREGDRLAKALSRLDILVHNASTYEPSPLGEVDAARAMRDYAVNAAAPLLLSARLAPLLSQSEMAGGGAIVAMCDLHAMGRPRKGFASYSMSKAALEEMVRSLARDLAPRVRVNGVAPGVVAWPEQGAEASDEEQKKYLSRVPLGRAGTVEDAAKTVRWLAMEATYVTGEVVRLDGGRWLA